MDAAMRRFLAVCLLLTLSACAAQPTPPPAPAPTVSSAPSAGSSLSADDVLNATVSLSTLTGDVPIPYPLANGEYLDPNGSASIHLLEWMAFGDLNADGAGDAAALVAESYGGSGTFVSLVVFLNQGGQPLQVAVTPIDDRPLIHELSIEAGQVALAAAIHGFEDPMCCPTLETERHYALDGTQLILRDFSTLAADGRWRDISITSPLDGESTSSIQVKGTVTISPFENNLGYHVFDAAGNELAVGPVTVTAVNPGEPGSFDAVIPLNGVSAGTMIRVEIRDLSAADGSLLALATVLLTIK